MTPEDVSALLERVSAHLQELERRVSALEHPSQVQPPHAEPIVFPSPANLGSTQLPFAQSQTGLFSIFGRSVLGIAGAYVLRAVAEAGALPARILVAFAAVYAASWLVWAAWPRGQTQLARYSYAITSALILSPMLWESTVRFQIRAPRGRCAVGGIRPSGDLVGLVPPSLVHYLGGNAGRSHHLIGAHDRDPRTSPFHAGASGHGGVQRTCRRA